MKYNKQIEKLNRGEYSREAISKLKKNAENLYNGGDTDAKAVLDAINISIPPDDYILFMGFCPGADFSERQDIKWKEKGICTFDYLESEVQAARFMEVFPGDLVILKKREKFGESMKLFGHGRVKSIAYNDAGNRYLIVDWSTQDNIIEVPLMGCNSTVDIKNMDAVLKQMPDEFFSWLEQS